ncbi:hypothetical protein V6Z12_D03G065200 [Gossypium hirsutum]
MFSLLCAAIHQRGVPNMSKNLFNILWGKKRLSEA